MVRSALGWCSIATLSVPAGTSDEISVAIAGSMRFDQEPPQPARRPADLHLVQRGAPVRSAHFNKLKHVQEVSPQIEWRTLAMATGSLGKLLWSPLPESRGLPILSGQRRDVCAVEHERGSKRIGGWDPRGG
eukprot:scaffold168866_cov25-Tisochrysis_lutea.AAC.3